jgi:hypothetical protein
MSSSPTNFSSADFDKIKIDLKGWLGQQTEFRDFNFNGPAISILIDALAYTANYMAVQANLSLTEVFLDSCQLRGSAVSRAKELGYFPSQVSSSRAVIRVSWTHPSNTPNLSDVFVPVGSRFSSGDAGSSYEFVTVKSFQLLDSEVAGTYTGEIEIHQGEIQNRSFTYPSTARIPTFKVPDVDVDSDYFRVFVTEPGDITATEYEKAEDIVDVGPTTATFFLQEGIEESIDFTLGDGVIGKRPNPGATIAIRYLTTVGKPANGVSSFSAVTAIEQGVNSVDPRDLTIDTIEAAAHGAPKQSLESIKYTAPKSYAAQNRCVTAGDYSAILLREFSFIETLSVWGGEMNDPPFYGRVFVSIKPFDGTRLSPNTKQVIREQVLEKFSIVGIIPDIVDPDYTFVNVTTTTSYNKELASVSDSDLSLSIQDSIRSYFTESVTKFESVVRFSRLAQAIDAADPSILGSSTTMVMEKRTVPVPFVEQRFSYNFKNPIKPLSVRSNSILTVSGTYLSLVEVEPGRIDAYQNDQVVARGIGSVNHTTGEVVLTSYRFDVPPNTEIRIQATPRDQDIYSKQNNLLVSGDLRVSLNRYYRPSTRGG